VGTYTARVEVTDIYGHKAVSQPLIIQVDPPLKKVYLPLTIR
jgi:hypothetical protein